MADPEGTGGHGPLLGTLRGYISAREEQFELLTGAVSNTF